MNIAACTRITQSAAHFFHNVLFTVSLSPHPFKATYGIHGTLRTETKTIFATIVIESIIFFFFEKTNIPNVFSCLHTVDC